ncbi:hypothetical protein ADUPG1_011256 [Aduncisulcus paluster]|uniref:Up-regulated during septation protein 1 domain-containing protein n=1 Tax=Aduncisulcus paluster TaxID=2918883 RepID=A0ABQ5JUY7_9EUKA|nr:hypothetical protein ADUPG1_011256 [Aduncisulcus paluster]
MNRHGQDSNAGKRPAMSFTSPPLEQVPRTHSPSSALLAELDDIKSKYRTTIASSGFSSPHFEKSQIYSHKERDFEETTPQLTPRSLDRGVPTTSSVSKVESPKSPVKSGSSSSVEFNSSKNWEQERKSLTALVEKHATTALNAEKELREQRKSFQEQLRDLKHEYSSKEAALKREKLSLSSDLVSLRRTLEDREKQSAATIDGLMEEVKRLEISLNECEEKASSERVELIKELRRAKEEVCQLQEKMSTSIFPGSPSLSRSSLSAIASPIAPSSSDSVQLEQTRKELQNALKRIEDQAKEYEKEKMSLENDLQSHKGIVESLKTRLTKLQAEDARRRRTDGTMTLLAPSVIPSLSSGIPHHMFEYVRGGEGDASSKQSVGGISGSATSPPQTLHHSLSSSASLRPSLSFPSLGGSLTPTSQSSIPSHISLLLSTLSTREEDHLERFEKVQSALVELEEANKERVTLLENELKIEREKVRTILKQAELRERAITERSNRVERRMGVCLSELLRMKQEQVSGSISGESSHDGGHPELKKVASVITVREDGEDSVPSDQQLGASRPTSITGEVPTVDVIQMNSAAATASSMLSSSLSAAWSRVEQLEHEVESLSCVHEKVREMKELLETELRREWDMDSEEYDFSSCDEAEGVDKKAEGSKRKGLGKGRKITDSRMMIKSIIQRKAQVQGHRGVITQLDSVLGVLSERAQEMNKEFDSIIGLHKRIKEEEEETQQHRRGYQPKAPSSLVPLSSDVILPSHLNPSIISSQLNSVIIAYNSTIDNMKEKHRSELTSFNNDVATLTLQLNNEKTMRRGVQKKCELAEKELLEVKQNLTLMVQQFDERKRKDSENIISLNEKVDSLSVKLARAEEGLTSASIEKERMSEELTIIRGRYTALEDSVKDVLVEDKDRIEVISSDEDGVVDDGEDKRHVVEQPSSTQRRSLTSSSSLAHLLDTIRTATLEGTSINVLDCVVRVNESLRATNASLSQGIMDLTNELEESKRAYHDAATLHEQEIKTAVEREQAKVTLANDRLTTLSTSLTSCVSELDELKKVLKSSEKKYRNKTMQLSQIYDKISAQQQEYKKELDAQVSKHAQFAENLAALLEEVKEDRGSVDSRVEQRLCQFIQLTERERESSEHSIESMKAKVASLTDVLKECKTVCDQKEERVKRINAEGEEVKLQLKKQMEADEGAHIDKIRELADEVVELREELATVCERMEKDNTHLRQTILEQQRKNTEELEKLHDDHARQLEQIQQEQGEKESDVKEETRSLRRRCAILTEENKTMASRSEEESKRMMDMLQRLQEIEEKKAIATTSEREGVLKSVGLVRKQLVEALQGKDVEMARLEEEMSRLRSELDDSMKEKRELEEKIDRERKRWNGKVDELTLKAASEREGFVKEMKRLHAATQERILMMQNEIDLMSVHFG